MPIEPVKIPADIQVEEKILGPISLRQIFLLMICGGISWTFWGIAQAQGNSSDPVIFTLCWSPLMIGAAFAFVKVNDVGLFTLVLLLIEKIEKPGRRTFGPRQGIAINIRTNAAKKKKEEEPEPEHKEPAPQEHLEHLSSILDTGREDDAPNEARPVDPERVEASPRHDQTVSMNDIHHPSHG